MRASVPLRTVVKSGEPIRARARLESARIKERYYYYQQISLNPSSEPRKEPEGEIKLIIPYDLDSTVERGFWAADGMMVQVSGLRLAADREGA